MCPAPCQQQDDKNDFNVEQAISHSPVVLDEMTSQSNIHKKYTRNSENQTSHILNSIN